MHSGSPRRIALFILCCALLFSTAATASERFITIDEFRNWQKLKKDLVLVDVRDTEAYQHEHLPGAISIPAGENMRFALYWSKVIVLYCWYDSTASEVAEDYEKGHPMHVLRGGIEDWKKRGLKTEK